MRGILNKRTRLLVFLMFSLLVGGLSWLVWREVGQSQLDNALIAAIKQRDSTRALALLQQGADPNARETVASFWPLLWAGLTGKSLHDTNTPTALAVVFGLEQVYDPNANRYRPEPIDIARALVERGADVNVKVEGSCGEEPLILQVADLGYPHCTKLLLEHGASANTRDFEGITALMYAALSRDSQTVKVLLEQGADVHARNDQGVSIFEYVSSENNDKVFALLKRTVAKK